ncbi:MAG: ROK family transcriptional regulator [Rhizobiaceae bacterium]
MPAIVRSDDLRRQNQRRILAALRRSGTLSRTELSAATGLSASTVTAITSTLVPNGILLETPGLDSASVDTLARRGRPQVALSLNPAIASVAALSLSLNRVSAALIDYRGSVISESIRRINTGSATQEMLKDALADVLRDAMANASGEPGPLRHIAVGVQGATSADSASMLWSPITTCTNVPLGSMLSREFAVPATLANDCSMIAEALRWKFPERYGDSFAAVLLSHGIGMGLFLRGELFSGIGSSATEFGHMIHIPGGNLCRCGTHGCIEAYAGDYAIWRAAHEKSGSQPPADTLSATDMAGLAERARRFDGPERLAYRKAGEAIGSGLRSMFALFDPFPVAFVGSGAIAFDVIEKPIRDALGNQAAGLATPRIEMQCFPDEFPLLRDGAMMSALVHLDNHVFGSGETAGTVREQDYARA